MTNLTYQELGTDLTDGPTTRGTAHGESGKRVRLPTNFIVALTPSSVFFYQWRNFHSRVKIKQEIVRVPREGLKAHIRTNGNTTVFGARLGRLARPRPHLWVPKTRPGLLTRSFAAQYACGDDADSTKGSAHVR